MTYADKLRDPRWLCRRAEVIKKADGRCRQCGAGPVDLDAGYEETPLEVHHVTYLRGREPWDHPDDILICLCRPCHAFRQVEDEEAKFEFARMIARLTDNEVREVTKALRRKLDGGWAPKMFDAYEAIKDSVKKKEGKRHA